MQFKTQHIATQHLYFSSESRTVSLLCLLSLSLSTGSVLRTPQLQENCRSPSTTSSLTLSTHSGWWRPTETAWVKALLLLQWPPSLKVSHMHTQPHTFCLIAFTAKSRNLAKTPFRRAATPHRSQTGLPCTESNFTQNKLTSKPMLNWANARALPPFTLKLSVIFGKAWAACWWKLSLTSTLGDIVPEDSSIAFSHLQGLHFNPETRLLLVWSITHPFRVPVGFLWVL